MKLDRIFWLVALLVMGLASSGRALVNDREAASDTNAQPYSAIWQRNVFDLKAPVSKEIEVTKTNAPPPNIKLTGIHNMFGKKQALFIVQHRAGPGNPQAKDDYVMLAEGQRQDTLEVLEIDQKSNSVKIKNEEVVSTISFDTNSVSSGAPGPASGMPPQRPVIPPNSPFFNRPMRGPMPPGFGSNGGQGGYNPQNNVPNGGGGYSPYGYSGGGGGYAGGNYGGTPGTSAASGTGSTSGGNTGGAAGTSVTGGSTGAANEANGTSGVNPIQGLNGNYSGVSQQNGSSTVPSLPLSTGVSIPTETSTPNAPSLPSLPAIPALPTDPVPALGQRVTGTFQR